MENFLFQPVKINQMEIKNRIYMPAMHLAMCEDFKITDQIVQFYARRAKGGAGLICVGYATIDDMSGNSQNIGAHKDEYLEGLAALAKGIKDNGARAAIQLNHSGRYNFSFFMDGRQSVAPSPIASKFTRETPRELNVDEINQIVNNFAMAARRVKKAGFDVIDILAGTGYLISEFLSPLTNKRKDEYGGSLENRMRFGLEVINSIRREVGSDFPLILRMNGNDFMPGGQGLEELQKTACEFVNKGLVDALCINVGWHEARIPQIVSSVPRSAFAYMAKQIKEQVAVPVIASHRINDPDLADQLIKDHMCDMVAMGRSLITDPDLPKKAMEGRQKEIIHCIACAQGCFDNLFKLKHVECLCNPEAGYENNSQAMNERVAKSKNVMVIGGGAAGMSAALAADRKGNNVTLYEMSHMLGGQLYLAALPPGREEFAQLAKDLISQIDVSNIDVKLNCMVDEKIINQACPEMVILATGAKPMIPPIPGSDLPHVVLSWDVLTGKANTGQKVVIIGGGAVGVETALFLAEKGTLDADTVKFLLINRAEDPETIFKLATKGTKDIVLLEMIDKIGKDIGKSTRWGMLQELSRFGIETNIETKALEITQKGVKVSSKQGEDVIPADSVVLAAGSVSHNPFEKILKSQGIEYKIIGDAGQIGLAFDAVHQGFRAGNGIS
ncbi:MAG: FAD-dependent oxidoreductase [Desulfobacula sp.]|nr:FAD-dependent oxidoreductase [Desulfobacula sp.]